MNEKKLTYEELEKLVKELSNNEHQLRRSLESLSQSEERFRNLIENSVEGILIHRSHKPLFVNSKWASIHGYSVEEVLRMDTVVHMIAPKDQKQMIEYSEARLQRESVPVVYEYQGIHRDGSFIWLDNRVSVVQWENQEAILTTIFDISSRKRAEEALRESEERLRNAQRVGKLGSWEWSLATKEMVLSEEALAIYGVEKKSIATLEEIVALVHPEDKLRVEQSLYAAIVKKTHHVLEHRAIRPDGEVIYVRTMAELYHDTEEKSIRLLGTIMDITEQKHAEMRNSKLEAENQLLQKAESLGRMAGAIAHHFNNNLGAVIGNLEMALDDLPEDAQPLSNLAAAMQAALKAAEISGLMLTYLGQTTGRRTLLNLSETCDRSLLLLQAAVPKNIVINVDLPTPGPTIRANANQLQQILTNLVTNAWEAIGENSGAINLIVKVVSQTDISAVQRFPVDWQPQDPTYACLEISDTGCGIVNEAIDKIFDPFYSTKFTGRGLGLPVVLGIARAHGGAVTVARDKTGSTFRVFLPLSAEKVPWQSMNTAQSSSRAGIGTVLLIEDEEMIMDMAKAMITRLGYTVIAAKDGVEAIEMFVQHQDEICCVVSDETMPRMNGWETMAFLRKLSPGIPVILCSGYDETKVLAGDHPERPQVFLHKPYRKVELKTALAKAMKG